MLVLMVLAVMMGESKGAWMSLIVTLLVSCSDHGNRWGVKNVINIGKVVVKLVQMFTMLRYICTTEGSQGFCLK